MTLNKKIFIFTMNENIFLFDLYIKIIKNNKKKIHSFIIINSKFSKNIKTILKEINYRIKFWGLVSTCKYIYLNIYFKFKSLGLKKLCHSNNIKFFKFNSCSAALKFINLKSPDFVFTSIDEYIPNKYLKNKTIFINSHCSILPKYKGYDSVFWAMLNNEKTFGATVHEINDQYDSGRIINQKIFKIKNNLSYYKILRRQFNLIYEMLDDLLKKELNYKTKSNPISKIFSKPSVHDGRKFRLKGKIFF